ncbi:hypothetical protein HY375_00310 [Candidatus Berkelbacteria bacterium]|nr:hypothetical protein [Candidatus Berkelbacteria bacterium]
MLEHDPAWRAMIEETLADLWTDCSVGAFSWLARQRPSQYGIGSLAALVARERVTLVIADAQTARQLENARVARDLLADVWVFRNGSGAELEGIDATRFRGIFQREDVGPEGLLVMLRDYMRRRRIARKSARPTGVA